MMAEQLWFPFVFLAILMVTAFVASRLGERFGRRMCEIPVDHHYVDTAQRRVAKLGRADLVDWADSSLNDVGKALTDYRRSPSKEEILRASQGLATLHAVLAELERRN